MGNKKLAPIYIASLPIWRERQTPLLLVRYGYCYYEGFLLIQLNTYLFVFCILIIITHFFVKHILGRQKRACIKKEKFYVKLIVHFTKKKNLDCLTPPYTNRPLSFELLPNEKSKKKKLLEMNHYLVS